MKLFAITRLTLLELRHSKLLVLPLAVAVALAIAAYDIKNPGLYGDDLVRGVWGTIAFSGGLVAVLAAAGAISSEIERGTMLLLASRPISRTSILAGKALGIALYVVLCGLMWSVVAGIGFGTRVDVGVWGVMAGGMVALAPALLAGCVALVASTMFPSRGAIGATIAVWLAAGFVAAIPLDAVKPSQVDQVSAAQDVLGTVLPVAHLAGLQEAVLGTGVPVASWWALAVIGAWFASAVMAFTLRRNLAR